MRNAKQDQAAYRWLTVSEVATDPRLQVSANRVRAMIAAKELHAIDVSTPGSSRPTWRVDPASVEELVKRRSNRAAT